MIFMFKLSSFFQNKEIKHVKYRIIEYQNLINTRNQIKCRALFMLILNRELEKKRDVQIIQENLQQ